LAVGATTEEDIELFRSRELSKLNLQPTDVMNAGAVALFYKNEDVDLYITMMLASMPGDICLSEAYDQYIGRVKGKRINEILACFKQKHH